jgi:riboflavin kinase / FMN adenylyltransferase
MKMKVLNSIAELPNNNKYGLIIGNFDGVHLGHQKLLKEVSNECNKRNEKLVVLTFIPHPLITLKNEKSFLINSYVERRELLNHYGVEFLIEIAFDRDLSVKDPSSFLEEYILINENVESLFLGHDFAFGANKKGDHNFVKNYCDGKKINIEVQKKFTADTETYSSSLTRDLLKKGEAKQAAKILGRPFFFSGRVIKGLGRGKQLGFPTANMNLQRERLIPGIGVYSTLCTFRGCTYKSITNIGKNPTFDDVTGINVETNIFDFSGDLYGEEIKVIFVEKIRDEKKFNSVNELIEQIKADVEMRKSKDD